MHALRLMAEYECYPLWHTSDQGLVNVDPFDLPIPAMLAQDVTEWNGQHEATFNRFDPAASGFSDVAAAAAWLRAGGLLAERLREHGLHIEYPHERRSASELVARPR